MNVLGIADGPDASAALAVNDRIVATESQASFDHRPRSRAFPWEAADDVLRRAGLQPGDVDQIAVAGRFTPPFFLRRNPGLRRMARDAFSVAFDLTIFYQAMLRQTGFGALEADRAAEWLERQFRKGGFAGRVLLVDIHTALANAAYRNQARNDVLIVTLHPMGDGVSLAVHRGRDGQVDRTFEQKGFSSVHVHLRRCAETLGFADARAMWGAAGPTSDPDLLSALSRSLRALDGKLSRNSYPFPERTISYDALRNVPVEVAAASVLENLVRAVTGVVAHHVKRHGHGHLAVAGEVFESTRLVSALADIDGVQSVACPSEPGFGALSWGAAAAVAGLPMRANARDGEEDFSALGGEVVRISEVVSVLENGGRVARVSGASGLRSWEDRVVLSRADRGVLEPGQRVLVGDVRASATDPCLANGVASVPAAAGFCSSHPHAVSADGRVREVPVCSLLPVLETASFDALRSVRFQHRGCPVSASSELLAAARESGVDLLWAGDRMVRL